MPEARSTKIVPFDAVRAHCDALRAAGRRMVPIARDLRPGLHPGHVAHLEGARALGDLLVVSRVTANKHVHKGPGRPYFAEHLRLASVASLECVDFVVLAPFPGAAKSMEAMSPRLLQGQGVRGPELRRLGRVAGGDPRTRASAAKSASPVRSRPAPPS